MAYHSHNTGKSGWVVLQWHYYTAMGLFYCGFEKAMSEGFPFIYGWHEQRLSECMLNIWQDYRVPVDIEALLFKMAAQKHHEQLLSVDVSAFSFGKDEEFSFAQSRLASYNTLDRGSSTRTRFHTRQPGRSWGKLTQTDSQCSQVVKLLETFSEVNWLCQ